MSSVLPAASSTTNMIPRPAVEGDLAETTAQGSQDRFLKLLVTQMRNQDPLNPMDNAQMTTQLAQISTVSGIEKLNTSLNGMADSMAASSSLQNASLIGRVVTVPGREIRFDGSSPVGMGVELSNGADRAEAVVLDASNNIVRRMPLGSLPQGVSTFGWDGRTDAGAMAPAGVYRLRVDAAAASGEVKATALVLGRVESVSVEGARSRLNLQGLGSFDVAQVRRID